MFSWFRKKGRKFGGSHIVISRNGGISVEGFNQFDVIAASLEFRYNLNDPCIQETCDQILNHTSLDSMINQPIVDTIRTKLEKIVQQGYFHKPITVGGYIKFERVPANIKTLQAILDNKFYSLSIMVVLFPYTE